MNYEKWSDEHSDNIALCIGAMFTIGLIIFAILGYIYE